MTNEKLIKLLNSNFADFMLLIKEINSRLDKQDCVLSAWQDYMGFEKPFSNQFKNLTVRSYIG
jgi:hypothetical protein